MKFLIVITVCVLPCIFGKPHTLPKPTPVVLWHGMGDSAIGMGSLKRLIEKEIPGVYVKSLMIGNNFIEDSLNSFIMHPNDQIEFACNLIKSDPDLVDGYYGIGFSQGSQFIRGLGQKCSSPKMKGLISIGGQQQGVYGIPFCDPNVNYLCDLIRPTVTQLAYDRFQSILAQATYWNDALNDTNYANKNTFIAELNNEAFINQDYVDNLQALDMMVLVKFEKDDLIIPLESQWFGFYKPRQDTEVQPLQETKTYTRLGLDKLDSEGKLHFLSLPGRHLEFSDDWFIENIINAYLK